MRRLRTIAVVLALGLTVLGSSARAQLMYPMGYGGYGMSRWGVSPNAGWMAGLGAYARGQGVYQVDKAKADAINVDTMVKWNKALRARQAALREDRRKEDARRQAERSVEVERIQVEDGTTLNDLLLRILDFDPGALKAARVGTPLGAGAIREIPFEWDSEAITLCIDQMTGEGSLTALLMEPKFAAERAALRAAVEPALKEDARGDVSPETRKALVDAVAAFRAKFVKAASRFEVGYDDSLDYLTTLASLPRMLNDPSMKAFLAKVEEGEPRTVGDLIAFMNAYNLRFGAAKSDTQIAIYRQLVPAFRQVLASADGTPSAPDRDGKALRAAAHAAFKGMSWAQLEAHSREQ